MLLPKGHLSIEEDGLDSMIDVVFVQNSGGYGREFMPCQNLSPRSIKPLKARIMKFEIQFDIEPSKYISRTAQRICSDLREARKTVDQKRPIIIVIYNMMSICTTRNFLSAMAEEDTHLPIADVIGLIYIGCSRDNLILPGRERTVLAASHTTRLELRPGVNSLTDYFTLESAGFEEERCEIEMLSIYGRTNLKILMETALTNSPRFFAGGKDMYHLDNAIPAAEYVTTQILDRVRDILRVMSFHVAPVKSIPMQDYQTPAASRSIIKWLSQSFQTLIPASPSVSAYNKTCGSGSWLLERPEFIAWWRSIDCPVFWLSGSPGSGKSTLTSCVIENLKNECNFKEERFIIIVHYFYDARYKASAPTAIVIREVISKLLSRQKNDQSRNRLQSVLADLNNDEKMTIGQLRSYYKEIQHAITVSETLILVLDGLDEVEEQERNLVEELLYLIQNWNSNHRIRSFVSANNFWGRREILDSRQRIHLDDEVRARQDLLYFVKNEVKKIFPDSYFAQAFYENLTTHSDGIFCRAILALRGLRKIDNSDKAGVASFINLMPHSLTGAHHDMLCRIPKSDRKKSFKLLTFVTYTFRPLRISELLEVMDFDLNRVYPGHFAKSFSLCEFGVFSYTKNDILRLSGGLLTFTKEKTVQFVHSSVRDNIMAQSSKLRQESLCMSEDQAHEMLSRICLYFLQSRCDKSISDPSETAEEPGGFISKQHHDFTDYALQYWSNHFKVGEAKSDHLQGLLQHLIQETCRCFWRNYYGCSSPFTKVAFLDSVRATLCIGAKVGSVKLVKMLLEMGAHLDRYVDFAGRNALHIAAGYGHLSVVKFLLKRGACVNMPSGINGRTPLQHATAAGHISVMDLLLHTESKLRKSGARYVHGNAPLRTVWVICHSSHCCFRHERKSTRDYENSLTAHDEQYESNVFSPAAPQSDQMRAPTLRPSNVGEGETENALPNLPYKHDWISKFLSKKLSSNKGEDGESSVIKFLVQQLLQTGIGSVALYSEVRDLQMPVLNHAEPIEILKARHLHLIIDAKDDDSMAQNWSKSLKIASQRRQEESIWVLLKNEAVAPPIALSSFPAKFKCIKAEHDGDYGHDQPQKPKCWTDSSA